MANKKSSKMSTKSTVKETSKKKNNLLDEDMENELVSSKNKIKKQIEVDEDEYDDEEYEKSDDTDFTETTSKVKSESHIKLHLEPAKVISYVTLAVSVITLIISIVVLCKVNNIESGKTKTSSNETDKKEETPTVEEDQTAIEYDVSMFKSLDADAFLDLFDKKDGKEYIVNVGRSTCPFSQQFLPVLQQSVKDYDYTLYYVSTTDSTIVNKAQEIIDKSEVFSTSGTSFGATPSTYVIKNGKVVDSFIGYDTYESFAKFLEKHDIKKK